MSEEADEDDDKMSFILPNMFDSSDSSNSNIPINLPSTESVEGQSEKYDSKIDDTESGGTDTNSRTIQSPNKSIYDTFVFPDNRDSDRLPIISEQPDLSQGVSDDLNSLPPLHGAALYIKDNQPRTVEFLPVSDTPNSSPPVPRVSSNELELPNQFDFQFLQPKKSSSLGPSSSLDFAYLTAQPLVIDKDGMNKIQVLNSAEEWKKIEDVIKKSEIKLRYEKAIATTENLQRVLNLGCRVLHLSGYGLRHRLIFEDEENLGVAQVISTSSLKKLLDALITKQRWLELVVVSACHSYFAGKAFYDNGIKSVVCVKYDTTVNDRGAETFSKAETFSSSFYNSLFSRNEHTVFKAFNGAKTRVEIEQPGEDKYMLLQDDRDHQVLWHRNFTAASDKLKCKNLSREPPKNCLPTNPCRVGREKEMQFVLKELNKKSQKRVVVIWNASKGSGKRAFALMLAHYLSERSSFAFDRIFFFEKKNLDAQKAITRKGKPGPRKLVSSNFAHQILLKQEQWSSSQRKMLSAFKEEKSCRKFMNEFPRKFVKDQNWLIILDHLSDIDPKQLTELKDFFNDLLLACSGIKLLITCRDSNVVLSMFEKWSRFAWELPPLGNEEAAELFYLSLFARFPPRTFGYRCKNVKSEIVLRLKNEIYIQLMKGIPGLIKSEALQIQRPPKKKKPSILYKLDLKVQDDLEKIVHEIEEEQIHDTDIDGFIMEAYKKLKLNIDSNIKQPKAIFRYLIESKCHTLESEFKLDGGRSERSKTKPKSFANLSPKNLKKMHNIVNVVLADHNKKRMLDLLKEEWHENSDLQLEEIYKYFCRNWIETTVFNETTRIEKKAMKWYSKFDFAHKLGLSAENPTIERVLNSIKKRLKDMGIIKEREYDSYFEDYWYDKLYTSFRDHPQLKGRLKSRTTMNAEDWKKRRKVLMEETIPIANVLRFNFFYVEKNIPMYKALHQYIDQKDPIILFGFITRQQAEDLVRTCEKHTFIIRFSVRKEGLVLTVFEGKRGMTPYKHFQFNMEIRDASEKNEITFTSCQRSEKTYELPYRTTNFVKLVKDLSACKYLYVKPPPHATNKSTSYVSNPSNYSKFYSASIESRNCWRIPKNLIFTNNPERYPA